MQLLDDIIDYLEKQIPGLYTAITAVPLGDARQAIAITIAPSRKEKQYFDGAVYDKMAIQISAKSPVANAAHSTVAYMAYMLERADKFAISTDENIRFIKAEINTNPNLAYMADNQLFVYVCLMNIYFERS